MCSDDGLSRIKSPYVFGGLMNRSLLNRSFVLTRRRFVRQNSTIALAATFGRQRRPPSATSGRVPDAAREIARGTLVDPALVRTLAMTALDAAKSAGATYADIRVTRTIAEHLQVPWGDLSWAFDDSEHLGLGVRVLVNGYWGFAATPYWTADESARVATSAVAQAKTNAKGPSRNVVLDPIPVVTGSWNTPVMVDPFHISVEEKLDFLQSTIVTARQMLPKQSRAGGTIEPGVLGRLILATCIRQEEALATTDGSYVTQTLYQSKGQMPIQCMTKSREVFVVPAQGLTLAGRGWEIWRDAKVLDQLPAMLAELESKASLPIKPAEVGRNDLVCDATTVAGILDATLGRATEVDRALGYEANAGGTSYLGPDPLTLLGTVVANPLVTVTANRSLAAGLATVRWDAEGVMPKDFFLVRDGVLVDYQTTREQAAWLAPWYARSGTPVQSHGCAAAANALRLTMQMTPNLTLAPAATAADFETLVSGLSDGIAVESGVTETDFQCRNGTITGGQIFQVKGGKRTALLRNSGILFTTSEFWKNVTALGGTTSVVHAPGSETKGEPSQDTVHTVSVVPAAIKAMALIDVTRKA